MWLVFEKINSFLISVVCSKKLKFGVNCASSKERCGIGE